MPDPDPTPDDLVVSAVLDGEASPDEAERVASDPRLAARLEQLRAVAAAVGGPVPLVDPGVRDAHLAAARAEARRLSAGAGPSAPPAPPPPVDLAAARARRRPSASRVLLSVAAALLVVVAAGTVLVRLGDLGGSGGGDEVATESDDRSSAESLGAVQGGADDGADSSADAAPPESDGAGAGEGTSIPTTTAGAPSSATGAGVDPELVSLGTFAKGEDLTAAVRGRLVLDPTPEAAGVDPICQDDFPVETTLLGWATVGREEGLVYVDTVPGSDRQVWFVDPATPGAGGEACRRIVPVDTV